MANRWSERNRAMIERFRAQQGKDLGPFGDRLLLLTTKGARSGLERTMPLAFTRDGDRYVVIASKGGSPENPDWYHNLLKHPEVTVEVGAEEFTARASVAHGADRDRLFAAHAAVMPSFNDYQRRTARRIPVVILQRVTT